MIDIFASKMSVIFASKMPIIFLPYILDSKMSIISFTIHFGAQNDTHFGAQNVYHFCPQNVYNFLKHTFWIQKCAY